MSGHCRQAESCGLAGRTQGFESRYAEPGFRGRAYVPALGRKVAVGLKGRFVSSIIYMPMSVFAGIVEDEYQSWSGERRVLEQVADVGAQAFGRG